MMSLTRGHRIYFAAVGLLALWVGVWGYFIPGQVDAAIPWLVPPLHARFLGAMYLSGATFMAGCLLARRWAEVRVVVPMIAIWTGGLFVVSLFYLNEFNYARPQVWIWFGAYIVYPLIAVWLTWRYRGLDLTSPGVATPRWVNRFLLAQGSVATVLGLALLLAPGFMVGVWPWRITPLLAHMYSAPFLSYGLGSLMHSRRQTWPEIRIAVIAIEVFTLGVLMASIIHFSLFSLSEIADWLWFLGFITASLGGASAIYWGLSNQRNRQAINSSSHNSARSQPS